MKKIKSILCALMILSSAAVTKGQEQPQYGEIRTDGHENITRGAFWKQRPIAKMIFEGSRPPGYTVWVLQEPNFMRFVDTEHNALDRNYIVAPTGTIIYRDDTTGLLYDAECGNQIEYIRPVEQTKVLVVTDTITKTLPPRYFIPEPSHEQQYVQEEQCCTELIISLSANIGPQYSYPQLVYMPMPMNYGGNQSGYYSDDDYYSNTTIVNNNTNNYVKPDPEKPNPAPVPTHGEEEGTPVGVPTHNGREEGGNNTNGGRNANINHQNDQIASNHQASGRTQRSVPSTNQTQNLQKKAATPPVKDDIYSTAQERAQEDRQLSYQNKTARMNSNSKAGNQNSTPTRGSNLNSSRASSTTSRPSEASTYNGRTQSTGRNGYSDNRRTTSNPAPKENYTVRGKSNPNSYAAPRSNKYKSSSSYGHGNSYSGSSSGRGSSSYQGSSKSGFSHNSSGGGGQRSSSGRR